MSRAAARQRRIARRRGAMLYLICLFVIIFIAMTALSVDVAYMHLSRTQLRSATDAAARAGAEALSRSQSTTAARDAAKALAAENLVAGDPLLLDDSDIVFGHSSRQTDGTWSFVSGGTPINSLQVLGQRTRTSRSGSVGLFFGRVFDVYDFQPVQSATVVKLDHDICIVLDRSSSMKLSLSSDDETISGSDPRFSQPPQFPDSRWAAAVAAVDVFVDTLQQTPAVEQCAVASFASDYSACGVNNVAAALDRPLTTDAALVKSAAHSYDTKVFNGMTNTCAGLDKGIAELTHATRARPYAGKTIVFLTDGFRTAGSDPLPSAQYAATKNIMIHTVSFGANFNQSELTAIAGATGGQHYHAPDAATLSATFREIALTTAVMMTK
jgi:hypothetical protein